MRAGLGMPACMNEYSFLLDRQGLHACRFLALNFLARRAWAARRVFSVKACMQVFFAMHAYGHACMASPGTGRRWRPKIIACRSPACQEANSTFCKFFFVSQFLGLVKTNFARVPYIYRIWHVKCQFWQIAGAHKKLLASRGNL